MLFLCTLISIASSKALESYLMFGESNPWQPITHFGMTLGTGNFTFRARLAGPLSDTSSKLNIKLVLYLGSDWQPTLSKQTCKERMLTSIKSYDVLLPGNTEWSTDIVGKLTQKHKPHVWYFVLSDCDGVILNKQIKYEFEVVNPNNEHFSVELIGIYRIYLFTLAILILALGKNAYEFIQKLSKDGEASAPLIWLNCSIIFQMVGIGFYCLHYYFYSLNGEGALVLEFLGDVFTVLASLSVSSLMVVVASGWTLIFKEFPLPELYVPGMFLVVVCHLVTIGMDFLQEKTSFSQYEGWKGFIVFVVRILMFAWFLWNLVKTSKNKDIKKAGFFYLFGIGASLYFLAVPLLVFGSYMFPVHLREMLMVGGTQFVQTAIGYFLYKIFTGKGDYYRLNTVLNILPGSRPHTY